jgi:hypothetical protein
MGGKSNTGWDWLEGSKLAPPWHQDEKAEIKQGSDLGNTLTDR